MNYEKEHCIECHRTGLSDLPGQPNIAACPDCGATREILVALIARRVRSDGSVRGFSLETRDIVTYRLSAMSLPDAIEEVESVLGTKIRRHARGDDLLREKYTLSNGDRWTGRFYLFDGGNGED